MAAKFKCVSKLIYNLIHDFLSTKQTSFVKKTWLKAAKSGSCFQAACRFSSHSCVTIQSAVGNTDCPGFGQNQVIPKTKKKKTKKKSWQCNLAATILVNVCLLFGLPQADYVIAAVVVVVVAAIVVVAFCGVSNCC